MSDPKPPGHPLGKSFIIIAWIIGLGLLTLLFNDLLQKQYNPNQTVVSRTAQDGTTEIVLERNRFGHYVTNGQINGQPVTFMVDTGATDVAIPEAIADRLGLERGRTVLYQTANGMAPGYQTVLDSVAIGPLLLTDVRASISPGFVADEILLGMSVLKKLEFTQRGNTLILRPIQ